MASLWDNEWFLLLITAGTILLIQIVVLILSGRWSQILTWMVGSAILLGTLGLTFVPIYKASSTFFLEIRNLQFQEPWWFLLLLTLPLLFWIAARNLGLRDLDAQERARLRRAILAWVIPPWGLYRFLIFLKLRSLRIPNLTRRWMGATFRALIIVCLSVALAEPQLSLPYQNVTVLFVLDRSASIPQELDNNGEDLRWNRIRHFMNQAVEERPREHQNDQAGLIVFGRQPHLELLPTDAPRFNLERISSQVDGQHTDIGSALQLAMATFPEGTAKRIVLITEGNENRGDAHREARLARLNGVEIDVLPLAEKHRREQEILIERILAPRVVETGERLPLKVWVRSYSSRPVRADLRVEQIGENLPNGAVQVEGSPKEVVLELGLQSFSFQPRVQNERASYTFEARITPRDLPGDRLQNNEARVHVVARGRRRILIIEAEKGEQSLLIKELKKGEGTRHDLVTLPASQLTQFLDPDRFLAYLSNFDSVVIANVPSDAMTEQQQEVIRSNVHDQGCGLVMIGGHNGFGAGGWQKTPVEEALPVKSEIQGLEIAEKSGLVLVMHACEMAQGNAWEKKIAKLAIERLGPRDEIGILIYDWTMKWHVPLQRVGEERSRLFGLINGMEPGDMPDFDPGLKLAHQALIDPKKDLASKHVIIITDGDPLLSDWNLLTKMRKDKVTVSTVGVATHGPALDKVLRRIAEAGRGNYHNANNPNRLPAIYVQEIRRVSQSFLHRKPPIIPRLAERSELITGLPNPLPPLNGFVRTTPKSRDSGVKVPIRSPDQLGQKFPILAHWRYGLGAAVAFTSDSAPRTVIDHFSRERSTETWCTKWASDPIYGKFWEQTLNWTLRPIESETLTLTAHHRAGTIYVQVRARTEEGEPDLALSDLRAEVTVPQRHHQENRNPKLRFEQTQAGTYVASFPSEEPGSYFIAMQAMRRKRKDGKLVQQLESARTSLSIPYAPEFASVESNPFLLEKLRQETGGRRYSEDEQELAKVVQEGTLFRPGPPGETSLRPIWHWLVLMAGVLLLVDVSVRRIAWEQVPIRQGLSRWWAMLRQHEAPEDETPEFLQRLQARKSQVGESLTRDDAENRFEAKAELSTKDAPKPQPEPKPTVKPVKQETSAGEEEDDFATRLMKAKKRALEEKQDRDRDRE